ncbi:hypothetical protein [Streptomyces sp. NPDC000994]
MEPEKKKDKVINFALGVAAVFFTAGAFVASIYGSNEGPHQQTWILAGVVSSALAVYVGNSEKVRLAAYRKNMRDVATGAQRSYENLIANLSPSISQAAVIADRGLPSSESAIKRGRLDQSIAVGVSEICEGARGIFYLWDSSTSTFVLVSQWPTSAVSEIKSGSVEYPALELVAKNGDVLVRPTCISPFTKDTGFAASADDRVAVVQVATNGKVIGVLVMDAKVSQPPTTSGFSHQEIRELLLYADLLAAGLGVD